MVCGNEDDRRHCSDDTLDYIRAAHNRMCAKCSIIWIFAKNNEAAHTSIAQQQWVVSSVLCGRWQSSQAWGPIPISYYMIQSKWWIHKCVVDKSTMNSILYFIFFLFTEMFAVIKEYNDAQLRWHVCGLCGYTREFEYRNTTQMKMKNIWWTRRMAHFGGNPKQIRKVLSHIVKFIHVNSVLFTQIHEHISSVLDSLYQLIFVFCFRMKMISICLSIALHFEHYFVFFSLVYWDWKIWSVACRDPDI